MADAPAPPTADGEKAHIDPVTGEKISKRPLRVLELGSRPLLLQPTIVPSMRASHNNAQTDPTHSSELKKRQKQREKEAKKADRASMAAAAAPAAAAATAAAAAPAETEDDLDPRQYFELRSRQIQRLRETANPAPYPHKFNPTMSMTEFKERFETSIKDGEHLESVEVALAGRVHNMRDSGQKLHFLDLHAEGTKIQVLAQAEHHTGLP
ncbi:lysyl-tRNA synthetase, partial [Cladochytrium tenue]